MIAKKRQAMVQLEYKQRRKFRKMLRTATSAAQEVREVLAYASGIDLLPVDATAVTEIPAAVAPPTYIPLNNVSNSRVFWDLETTGLGKE